MLILSRKPSESFLMFPDDSVSPDMTVRELFAHGPIEVMVTEHIYGQVRIGVNAPQSIKVLRSELVGDGGSTRMAV